MKDMASAAKIHVTSWHEMHREATDLANEVASHGPWQGLIAVSRGGLVPAAIVARVLDIHLIETVCIASFDGKERGQLEVIKPSPAVAGKGLGWLLVDDVADSGATAAEARQMLPEAHYASLYVKPAGRPFVDTFLREVDQDVWIDFPWDRDPAKI